MLIGTLDIEPRYVSNLKKRLLPERTFIPNRSYFAFGIPG